MAISDKAKALRQQLTAVDSSIITSAIAKFSVIKCSTKAEVQDNLGKIFWATYGDVLGKYRAVEVATMKAAELVKINANTADQDKILTTTASAQVNKTTFTTSQAQSDEALKIKNAFTQTDKDKFFTAEALARANAAFVKTAEWMDAFAFIQPNLSIVIDAFMSSNSSVDGKLNADLMSGFGRNLTIASVASVTDFTKVLDGTQDWKALFSDATASFAIVQAREEGTIGATFGGLSNQIDFGSDAAAGLKSFISSIVSDDIINFIKTTIKADKSTDNSIKLKNAADALSTKLNAVLKTVKTTWQSLEPYVDIVLDHINDTNNDAIKDAMKPHDEFIDNVDKDKDGNFIIITDVAQIRLKNIMREGQEELKFDADGLKAAIAKAKAQGLSPSVLASELFAKAMLEFVDQDHINLVVGGDFGKDGRCRDPLFMYDSATGLTSSSEKISPRVQLTTAECYAGLVKPSNISDANALIATLETLKSGTTEIAGLQKKTLWGFMQYCGSIQDPESGDLRPLGGKDDKYATLPVFSPYSKFGEANDIHKQTSGTYHHEMWVAFSIGTKAVVNISFAAVVDKLKGDFVKANASDESKYNDFIAECQLSGFTNAIAKYSTDANKADYAKVIAFVQDQNNKVVETAKGIFKTNYENFVKTLSSDLAANNQVFDPSNSADFMFWLTDNKLALFAKGLFGEDNLKLFGQDFAVSELEAITKIGRETYFGIDANKSTKVIVEAREAEKVELQTEAREVAYANTLSDEDSALFIMRHLWFPDDYEMQIQGGVLVEVAI